MAGGGEGEGGRRGSENDQCEGGLGVGSPLFLLQLSGHGQGGCYFEDDLVEFDFCFQPLAFRLFFRSQPFQLLYFL